MLPVFLFFMVKFYSCRDVFEYLFTNFFLLILFANIILGLLVFLNNRKNPVNISFSFIILSIIFWNITVFFSDLIKEFNGVNYTLNNQV